MLGEFDITDGPTVKKISESSSSRTHLKRTTVAFTVTSNGIPHIIDISINTCAEMEERYEFTGDTGIDQNYRRVSGIYNFVKKEGKLTFEKDP